MRAARGHVDVYRAGLGLSAPAREAAVQDSLRTQTQTDRQTDTFGQTDTHARTDRRTRTDRQTRTHARTRTRTHAHTQISTRINAAYARRHGYGFVVAQGDASDWVLDRDVRWSKVCVP